jgi:hypothetical protein
MLLMKSRSLLTGGWMKDGTSRVTVLNKTKKNKKTIVDALITQKSSNRINNNHNKQHSTNTFKLDGNSRTDVLTLICSLDSYMVKVMIQVLFESDWVLDCFFIF